MNRVPRITRIAALAATLTGGAIALALPAGADVSILSPPVAAVQVGTPATLTARGAAVTVPISVACAPGGQGFLSVEVVQRVGHSVARGNAFTAGVPCTGGLVTVNVTVSSTGEAFRKGTAFATANLTVCDSTGCLSGTDEREIEIVR